MKKLVILALALSLVMGMAGLANAATIFSENFQSYSDFNDLWTDRGDPWYWGRVGGASGSPNQDAFLINIGGSKFIKLQDDTGMFLQVDTTGYENVTMSFDWATGSVNSGDYAKVGYRIADLSGSFTDGWTNSNLEGGFTETNLGWSASQYVFQAGSIALPDDSSFWVFLALEDGNGDFAYFDNITISGDEIRAVPVPAAVWLLGSGLVGLAGLRRKYFG